MIKIHLVDQVISATKGSYDLKGNKLVKRNLSHILFSGLFIFGLNLIILFSFYPDFTFILKYLTLHQIKTLCFVIFLFSGGKIHHRLMKKIGLKYCFTFQGCSDSIFTVEGIICFLILKKHDDG